MTLDKLMMFHMAVNDMDAAKAFYTEKLGLKVTKDFAYDATQAVQAGVEAGSRWISLELPGGGTSINLTNVFENMKPGSMKLYLSAPDIEAARKDLIAKGIEAEEIIRAGWGTSFGFADPDSNQWRVVESRN